MRAAMSSEGTAARFRMPGINRWSEFLDQDQIETRDPF